LAVGRAARCGILRHVAAKTTQRSAWCGAALRGTVLSVNAA